MQGVFSSVVVITQSVVAGFVLALCVPQWTWWRRDRDRAGSGWLLVWTSTIVALVLASAVLDAVPVGPAGDAVLFVRAQALAACVVVTLPAVRAVVGGPPLRPFVLAACAGFVLRAVLWLTTDLVAVHGTGAAVVRGPLAAPSSLVPLAVVGTYVLLCVRGLPRTRRRTVLAWTSLLSGALLAVPSLLPVGEWTRPVGVIWTVPLASVLTALAVRRLGVTEPDTGLEHRIRDTLAEVGDAARRTSDPVALLACAQQAARDLLGDTTVVATTRQLTPRRFATTFEWADGSPIDRRSRGVLDDLARIVSVATERTALTRELEQAALTDPLTGLPNRHGLDRDLARILPRASEDKTRVAVLYCDMDGFKVENDLHGHVWGDELLVRTAGHLRACAVAGDVVARFGGDEFVLVTERAGAEEELVELARRIRHGLGTGGGERPMPRLSVGVAVWCPLTGGSPDDLLRQADTAMLEGKRNRSGVVVFDEALRARMRAAEELRRDLDGALVDDEFAVHFQPVVESRTMRIVGVEALARWQHAGRTRMPGEWLDFAEDTGLIVPIGRRVLGLARDGAHAMGLPVMVNVAARQLAEPLFVEHLVADWGTGDWADLTLEITESALLQDLPHVLRSLSSLRARGARIAIDDFGTGYSSFARLASLPVDVLKIDRAFVDRVTTDEGRAVITAIVSLAAAYRLEVVAEGVETLDQLEGLVELGVPKVQGYLLGRPASGRPAAVTLPAGSAAARRGSSA